MSKGYVPLGRSLRLLRFHLRMAWARHRLSTIEFPPGLGSSAWLLYGLVRSLQPKTCVEIGSANGTSTCHIALALRENVGGRLYAIDPHQTTDWNDEGAVETLPVLRSNLRRCGVEKYVEILKATSAEAADGWKRPIDFLFIDGDHSYDGVRQDWELFSPHLSSFGVVVFHDTTWDLHGALRDDMGVPRFLEELRRARYPIVTIDRNHGLSLVQNQPDGHPLTAL